MIFVTGASGKLGRIVIDKLLTLIEPSNIIAGVRNPDDVSDLAQQGVNVRQIDYNDVASLVSAFQGVEQLLLISSSDIGRRVVQHNNVIKAAEETGVKLLAYTSILRADTSPLPLAKEHKETEKLLQKSGLKHVILRNGWYSENNTASVPVALEYGIIFGCAQSGKVSSAPRADYAEAAVKVLTTPGHEGKVYELAGDQAYTLDELAAEIKKQTGKQVIYEDLIEEAFIESLKEAGASYQIAEMLAESDLGAAKGGLFDDSRTLSRLIGRKTTPMADSIQQVLVELGELS